MQISFLKSAVATAAILVIAGAVAGQLAAQGTDDLSAGIHLDGYTLDAPIQAMLAQDAAASAATNAAGDDNSDPGATAAGRAEIRRSAADRWSSRTAEPPTMRAVEDDVVLSGDVTIPVRIYHPQAAGPLPIIVYYHGGGWFIGGIRASDRSSRQLADDAQAIVISVEYRLAPEAPFPASWDDAEASYEWAVSRAEDLGGSPDQVCVGGDSAGGNMAIAVTNRQRAKAQPLPLCQILYYPAVDNRTVDTMRATYNSSRLFGEGFALNRSFTDYILPIVFPGRDLSHPEISPLMATPGRVPPTLIATAGFDPLRDSQREYAARLAQAGNYVIYREFPTLIHGFLQHTALSEQAVRASQETAKAAGVLAREAAAEQAAQH